MADAGFTDFHRNAQSVAPRSRALVRSRVVAAPATTADLVPVQAVNDASAGRLYLGDASWPKPSGKEKPAAGDECLVAIDDENAPWIIAWAVPNWGH